ncbi:hypothetical protein SLEP1_g5833 [Rubroshorea leprosula]|uniref:Uncharacterized protein n=1 Tax=Rubroshorea leprosula TaxID=152421 RepID=A0AAV5HZ20_9ROSI|nr:hypothetical protein SLEP1_g5833 [Rubroshorea leprosula]
MKISHHILSSHMMIYYHPCPFSITEEPCMSDYSPSVIDIEKSASFLALWKATNPSHMLNCKVNEHKIKQFQHHNSSAKRFRKKNR